MKGCFLKTNTAMIEVDGRLFHTLNDLGLAIGNTDYIGDPVQDESMLIFVPGRTQPLDPSETVFGGPVYQYRPISVSFGGIDETTAWDERISRIRNLFDGKNIKISFWTESDWYWQGKARITEFSHVRRIGRFKLEIPYADAYKHRDRVIEVQSTAEGVTVYAENSRQPVYPVITTDAAITVSLDGTTVSLSAGTHKNTAIRLTKCANEIQIEGAANVTIAYTEGSL